VGLIFSFERVVLPTIDANETLLKNDLVLGFLRFYYSDGLNQPAGNSGTWREFEVKNNDSLSSVAARLKSQGLIRDSLAFKVVVYGANREAKPAAGIFYLKADLTPRQIGDILMPSNDKVVVRILPGWRATQIAKYLASPPFHFSFTPEEFLKEVREGTFNYPFVTDVPVGAGLEGFLFPDTYYVSRDITAYDMVDKMLGNFQKQFDEAKKAARTDAEHYDLSAEGYSAYDIIKLASIVKREVVIDSEGEIVAGVYINRLKEGWLLQADPTAAYGRDSTYFGGSLQAPDRAALLSFTFWQQVSSADLAADNPFNTYVRAGFPPTPICSPGKEALEAALYPRRTPYFFFVAIPGGGGRHDLSVTEEEHNAKVKKYYGG